jgi:hypothetical protein
MPHILKVRQAPARAGAILPSRDDGTACGEAPAALPMFLTAPQNNHADMVA